jgi:hypothetical protein
LANGSNHQLRTIEKHRNNRRGRALKRDPLSAYAYEQRLQRKKQSAGGEPTRQSLSALLVLEVVAVLNEKELH